MILSKLTSAGFKVDLQGDRLLVSPFNRLTADQRRWLKSHRAALIAELREFDEWLTGDCLTAAANEAPAPVVTPMDCRHCLNFVVYAGGRQARCIERRFGGGCFVTVPSTLPVDCSGFEAA